VGNIVGDLAHTGQQLFNACQHGIKMAGKLVKLIVLSTQCNTPRQLACGHLLRRGIDRIDTL